MAAERLIHRNLRRCCGDWPSKIGPAEVAAVLARLVAEGKMTSEVRPGFTLLGFAIWFRSFAEASAGRSAGGFGGTTVGSGNIGQPTWSGGGGGGW